MNSNIKKQETLFKRKLFLPYEHEKEEAWLAEMSLQGWQLESVGWCAYTFVKDTNRKNIYRLDYQSYSDKKDIKDYIDFYESTGCKCIARIGGWFYFCKEAKAGAFELYTDSNSKQILYKRILGFLALVGLPNFMIFVNNMSHYIGALNGNTIEIGMMHKSLTAIAALIQVVILGLIGYSAWDLTRKIKKLSNGELANK